MRSSHVVLDQVDITFDDPRAVAHAGLLRPPPWPSGWGSSRPPRHQEGREVADAAMPELMLRVRPPPGQATTDQQHRLVA